MNGVIYSNLDRGHFVYGRDGGGLLGSYLQLDAICTNEFGMCCCLNGSWTEVWWYHGAIPVVW